MWEKFHQSTLDFTFVRNQNLAVSIFHLQNIQNKFPTSVAVNIPTYWDVMPCTLVDD